MQGSWHQASQVVMAWCQPPGWAEKQILGARGQSGQRETQIDRSSVHERGRVSDDRKRWAF